MTATELAIIFNTAGIDNNVRAKMNYKEQRELFGFEVMGRKCFSVNGKKQYVVINTINGMSLNAERYTFQQVADAINNRVKLEVN